MLRLFIIFLIILAGIILGPMLAGQQGLALFQIANYRISMSFTTFVLATLLLLLVAYAIYCLVRLLWKGSRKLSRRSAQHSLERLYKAQQAVLTGDFKKAQRLFLRNAHYQRQPVQSYLLAAQAALRHKDTIAARYYLDDAAEICQEKDKLAFAIVQLQYLLHNQEWKNATQQVVKLLADHPRNPQLLRLAEKIYDKTQNYQALIELLPQIDKTEIYSEAKFNQLQIAVYSKRMVQLAQQPDKTQLLLWWKEQPRSIRHTPELQSEMERHLSAQGQLQEAEKIAAQLSKQLP